MNNQAGFVQTIEKLEDKLIHSHIKRELLFLYLARVLLNISMTSLGVFLPIYFYTKTHSIFGALIIFALIYFVYIVVAPFVAKLFEHFGLKKMMILGKFFAVLSVLVFVYDKVNVFTVFIFVLFSALYRAFYWVPYQVDLAEFLDKKHRAGQLAFLMNISSVVTALSPFLTGYLIYQYGFNSLFYFASFMMLFAILILFLFVPDTKEKFSWNYMQTYKNLFKKENFYLIISQMAFGAQSVGFVVIWPIFIYMLFSGNTNTVGIITTLTLFAIFILRFIIAKIFDSGNKSKVIKWGAIFTSSGWFAKLFVNTPVDVILIDTYHRAGREVNRLAFNSATYEQMSDSGTYIDEFTILKEIALNIGRIIMIIIASLFIYYFGIRFAFILAGIASLFMIFISRNQSGLRG